mgnify:CR=1 FL=1
MSRMSEDTKKWFRAAGRRAVKTVAQTFVATVGTAAVMGEVNWPYWPEYCPWQHP